jgi:hypothetical protein
MGGHSAAVSLAALDSATKALGASRTGGQRVHQLAVDGYVLGVIPSRIVKLVCSGCDDVVSQGSKFSAPRAAVWLSEILLTMHCDLIARVGGGTIRLNWHLRVGCRDTSVIKT